MTEISPQFDFPEVSARGALNDGPAARVVVHVTVAPKGVASWRMRADTELRAHSSEVWLTRERHHDDYWLRSGDVVLLKRGERIWLSTDGDTAVQITFTCRYVDHQVRSQKLLDRLRCWLGGGLPIGA